MWSEDTTIISLSPWFLLSPAEYFLHNSSSMITNPKSSSQLFLFSIYEVCWSFVLPTWKRAVFFSYVEEGDSQTEAASPIVFAKLRCFFWVSLVFYNFLMELKCYLLTHRGMGGNIFQLEADNFVAGTAFFLAGSICLWTSMDTLGSHQEKSHFNEEVSNISINKYMSPQGVKVTWIIWAVTLRSFSLATLLIIRGTK